MAWVYAIVYLVLIVVAIAMIPKPQVQPPAGFDDIQVPTAEEGREIPVLFGTRDLRGPNIVWYGDFEAVAVKKKGGKK